MDKKRILALISISILIIFGLITYLRPLRIDPIENQYQYSYNNSIKSEQFIDRTDIDKTDIDKIIKYLTTVRFSRKSDWPQMFGDQTISILIQQLNSPKAKPIDIYYLADKPNESFIHYGNRIYKLNHDDIAFIESIIMSGQ